jgi:hypothetical protein
MLTLETESMATDNLDEEHLFQEAVRAYLEHQGDEGSLDAQKPDREMSLVRVGADRAVALRNRDGAPLGTVVWYDASTPVFEPPTKVTVVDHFSALRPSKA